MNGLLLAADFVFLNHLFPKKSSMNIMIIRVSNSLDPDQARQNAQHFVGPDTGPNCLQRLSADNTIR